MWYAVNVFLASVILAIGILVGAALVHCPTQPLCPLVQVEPEKHEDPEVILKSLQEKIAPHKPVRHVVKHKRVVVQPQQQPISVTHFWWPLVQQP